MRESRLHVLRAQSFDLRREMEQVVDGISVEECASVGFDARGKESGLITSVRVPGGSASPVLGARIPIHSFER